MLSGKGRAVRQDNHITVSSTDSIHGNRIIGGKDVESQFHFVVDKIEGALNSLGGRLEDIVCTDVFIGDEADAAAVTRVHGERFRGIQLTNKLTQAKLDAQGCLVEIQADAIIKG